ncbi:polysaccharide export protein [Mucilaginibacter robiniae]|uniref:Polysaccharide export protein n=1 Tax=Mucilaginibacter robiniae TaxID=2728022 RepID=A0A7L5E176_9SPHI|nr:polysaccharide biosynthesis/export family protein [Mucilaginibacter robiniae]QJD96945.1 polysaccharide export protein [Mucilaginibacter robiniae]
MKIDTYLKLIIILLCACLFSSCFSVKRLTYFQKTNSAQSDTIAVAKPFISKIQPGDIISVFVSSLSPQASSFFNPYTTVGSAQSANGSSASGGVNASTTPGYLVDPSGEIEIPLAGTIKVSSLTTTEARDTIKQRLKKYLMEPTVTVRVLNYKISMLGEVAKPSVYVIPNEQVTLPEALSMAGDLTNFANRSDILIVRDNNGKKEFGHVNLNSREVYSSPYYYLHSNDVVYARAVKARALQMDPTFRIETFVASLVSLIIVLKSRL